MTDRATRTITKNIDGDHLAEVVANVRKFNERATRRGLPTVTLTVGPELTRTERDSYLDLDRVYTEHECSLVTPPLDLGDYALAARVEPLARNGAIEGFVVTAPGESLPADYTLTDPFACDHCGTRRTRNATFVVRHRETGALSLVGRNCLRDFLGHDPNALLAYWVSLDDFTDDDEDGWGGSGRRPDPAYKPDDILRLTARVVAALGWVSKREADETGKNATGNSVGYLVEGPWGSEKERAAWHRFDEKCAWTDRAKAIYEMTKSALDDLAAKERRVGYLGDWEANVLRLATADAVPAKRVGFLASAVVLGWKRVNAPRTEKPEPLAKATAAEGDKVEVTGKVVYTNVMDSNWGATTLVKVETAEPRRLYVWWASGALTFERDETVTLKGTVKRVGWDEYAKGEATTLTRCRVTRAA